MTTVALLYHHAADPALFRNHVGVIASTNPRVLLTFDDAGLDAYSYIADELEARGLRGYFFIRADRIGEDGFLQSCHIRELRRRGHIIGGHLFAKPSRISRYTLGDVIHEFSQTCSVLHDITGERIVAASVPGSHYPSKLARAAAIASIETVFTAEPTLDADSVEGCTLQGRFTIEPHTSLTTAAALARGAFLPRLGQSIFWNLKRYLELTALVPQLHRHG
jgi:peptidoglycan/xylan/chitin deacetylase (PgdA/CDA1 family)